MHCCDFSSINISSKGPTKTIQGVALIPIDYNNMTPLTYITKELKNFSLLLKTYDGLKNYIDTIDEYDIIVLTKNLPYGVIEYVFNKTKIQSGSLIDMINEIAHLENDSFVVIYKNTGNFFAVNMIHTQHKI